MSFFSMVTRTKRGIAQKLRLQKIHRLALESIGCPMGPAAESEAMLLVEKLKERHKGLHSSLHVKNEDATHMF
jgi:hypothetical protein